MVRVTERLGPYAPTRVLGSGSMGVVYETRDPRVVVKQTLDPSEYLFSMEQQHKQYPGIVPVFDVFRLDGEQWIVRERVEIPRLSWSERTWLVNASNAGMASVVSRSSRLWRQYLTESEVPSRLKILADTFLRLSNTHVFGDCKPANIGIDRTGILCLFDLGGVVTQN